MSCFTVKYAQSTVVHYSADVPRTISLSYDGDRVAARPFIYADVSLSAGAPAIAQFWLQAKVNWGSGWSTVTFLNGDQTLHFVGNQTQQVRLAGQFNASAHTTGAYPLQITATAQYSNGRLDSRTDSTQFLLVVNTRASTIARGWTVIGAAQLVVPSVDSV